MTLLSVLVADPQWMFAEGLAAALKRSPDLTVINEHPGSGPDIVRAVEAHRPAVVVCEYWLEGMRAPAAARSILWRVPGTTVIAVSWLLGPPQITESLSAGIAGFLTKNEPVARLVEGIRQAHAGEWPVFQDELEALVGRISQRGAVTQEAAQRFNSLTPREMEVLQRIGGGLDSVQIAEQLRLRQATVRSYIDNILTKTGTHSQVEAVALARDQHILSS